MQLDVDVTQVVDPYSSGDEHVGTWDRLSQAELRQFTLKHSWDVSVTRCCRRPAPWKPPNDPKAVIAQTPITPTTSATVTGHMISRNGIGNGNLLGTIRHTFSQKLWAEVRDSAILPATAT